ncbi:MAG: helix-turn-helix domain-containing protein [Novosphingobium sp.]
MITPYQIEPICVKVNEAARMIGVGRTKLYELIAAGEVDVVKLGNSTRVTTESLRELIKRQYMSGQGRPALRLQSKA